jgi:hypothetical protein
MMTPMEVAATWKDEPKEDELQEKSVVVKDEKLYKASEWREAKKEHHLNNPQAGDYWFEDMYVPWLVVLHVVGNHVVVCEKTKSTDESHWTWDLEQVQMYSKEQFKEKLSRYGRISDSSHYWAAEAFKKAKNET